jgi:metal transporter CNNM
MMLTFPLSFPISLILDRVLGAEIGTVYDKRKLIELLRVTDAANDLGKDEVDIVTGALIYKDKTVRDVMTRLEDVYMLPMDAVLDFETVSEIRDQGRKCAIRQTFNYKNPALTHTFFLI